MTISSLDPEILAGFVQEARGCLPIVRSGYASFRRNPERMDSLQEAHRLLHNIKGSSSMVGLTELSRIASGAEDLLEQLEDGERHPGEELDTVLEDGLLAIEAYLDELEEECGKGDIPGAGQQEPAAEADSPLAATAAVSPALISPATPSTRAAQPRTGRSLQIPAERIENLAHEVSELLARETNLDGPAAELSKRAKELHRVARRLQLLSRRLGRQGESVVAPLLERATDSLGAIGSGLEETARALDSHLLWTSKAGGAIRDHLDRLDETPISSLEPDLARAVRSTAEARGELAELIFDSGELALRATDLELLREPLLHLVENAVVHGVETPEQREAAGKPATGRIRVHARQEELETVVEISDDGAGLRQTALRAGLVGRGLASPTEAAAMSEKALFAAFADRGVDAADLAQSNRSGLGIVATAARSLGGSVALHSRPGLGTTCSLRWPSGTRDETMLLVTSEPETVAIPWRAVRQMLRPREDFAGSGSPVRIGGRALPVVDLGVALGQRSEARGRSLGRPVVVLETAEGLLAVTVDELQGTTELAVRSLGPLLKELGPWTGAGLAGDGSVVLVLEPRFLVPRGVQ